MSGLPGNPFENSYPISEGAAWSIDVRATYALAFEQRTANLLALYETGGWPGATTDNMFDLKADIAKRLGLI